MENPNEYNDEDFTRASNDAINGIGGMWEAGASEEDIEAVVQNGLENIGLDGVSVTISILEVT